MNLIQAFDLIRKTEIKKIGNLYEMRCPLCNVPIRMMIESAAKGKLLHHIERFHDTTGRSYANRQRRKA